MRPRDTPRVIERRQTPRGEWVLRERDGATGRVFEVIANGTFLMDTREAASERALASLALMGRTAPRVLVGGLGLGFTLRACLDFEPTVVEVVEIEPALVDWVRGPVAEELGDPLGHPRVELTIGDVYDVLGEREGRFDAILLDTDNGPSWLVDEGNARIYASPGLSRAVGALRPGGALALWAAAAEPALHARLSEVLSHVREEHLVVEREGRELDYFVYLGVREST